VHEQREADDQKHARRDSKSHAAEEETPPPSRPVNEKNRLRNLAPTFSAAKKLHARPSSQCGRREKDSVRSNPN
jgi:hypothetical protein